MRRVAFLLVCILGSLTAAQSPPTAAEIMARVGGNQDRAEKVRQEYVYQQHVHVISRLANGKLMREETYDYDVLPTLEGTKKELKARNGRYFEKGKYLEIKGESASDEDGGLDESVTSGFVRDLVNDKSKDGLAHHLFPLTTEEQKQYKFKLIGEAEQDGRAAYRIGFSPRDKDQITWAGEALIDKEDFQPVLVYTKLSKKLPLLVRGALGTDVPGVGFSVHYKRQPDGAWFPVSFGTEFRLKVLFLMKRNIVLSLENKNFKHTHVDSTIKVAEEE